MKQSLRRYDTALNIINYAIENNCSVKAASEHYGYSGCFIKDYLTRGDINANLIKGTITKNEYDHIINLYGNYKNTKGVNNIIDISATVDKLIQKLDAHITLNEPSSDDTNLDLIYNDILTKTKKGLTNFEVKDLTVLTGLYNTYKDRFVDTGYIKTKPINKYTKETDLSLEEKYDKRSSNNVIRDEDGKIIKYTFRILVRDEPDFIGELTREQMETIYANYPYVTQKSCSQFFPYLTFPQFKKIVRCFNITKDMLFPQHILEEKSEEEAAKLALKHKELSAYKKFQELKPVFLEKELHDTKQELFKLKQQKDAFDILLKEYISEHVEQLTPIIKPAFNSSNFTKEADKALVIYLSDMHIGAENKEVQYSGEYNKNVYLERLNNILKNVKEELDTHNFEKIYIIGLGDQIDGFNAETTRGGHALPQNLTNKEQFNIYLNSMIDFVENLTDMFNGTIEFIHVLESNHGGDFEYGANKALEHILPLKFPSQAKARVLGKNIDHFHYGVHTLICTHGKDNHTMSRNLPMYLNPNTITNINEYIDFNKIKSDSILLVKGDLHNHTSETSKRFKYINVPSIYGGSGYTDANFGRTKPATLLHILHKNKTKINEIYIDLV